MKKAFKILIIIVLVFFAIPATAFIILQNKQIQTYLARKVASAVSENLQADFTIESMDMILFNRVVMKKVLMRDTHGDTLLFAPTMVATLRNFSNSQKKISLNRLKLENATIRIAIDTARVHNLKFIVDVLRKPPDSTRTNRWTVGLNAIDFTDSRFIFENHFEPREPASGINFSDLRLNGMHLKLEGFRVANDTVRFRIDHLSFREKSGFSLEELQAKVLISREFFLWRDVHLWTRQSEVMADRIDFRFNKWREFGRGGFPVNIDLRYSFEPSRVHLADLAYFSSIFSEIDESVKMSGDIRGMLSSLKGDDILLEYGQNSHFSGSFDLIGLPDFQETYMYFDIKDLSTSVADIERIHIPGASGETIELSENLSELGNISYRGKYVGFFNDFVTYGSFTTDLGNISSDLSIRPDPEENVHFRGEISMEGFDLGRLAELDALVGNLSMDGNVEGISYNGGGLSARMDGTVSLLELNGYPYRNITLAGDLSNRMFDGSFSVADPNLRMEFLGKIDFTDTLPVFDFTANVDKAMLHTLNIAPSDPSYNVSCFLRANFIGANLNDFDGEIKLVNSLFQKQDKQIQIYDFNLYAHHRPDTDTMILRSDLVDAEITGYYEFEDLGEATGKLLAHHLPSFRNIVKSDTNAGGSLNNFRFNVHFKNTFPITDFFYPQLEIARNSSLSGHYFPLEYQMELRADFPGLVWKANHYDSLNIDLISNDSIASLETYSKAFRSGSRINMENLKLNARAYRDELFYGIGWHNRNAERLDRGNISGKAEFEYRRRNVIPRVDLWFNRGEVILGDSVWTLAGSSVSMDSTYILIDSFRFSHASQALTIDGVLSKNPSDRLNFYLQNLQLSQINRMLDGLELAGTISGTSTISGIYANPVFLSDLRIDSLSINREMLGNTYLRANWINPEQKVRLSLEAMRGQLKTLALQGDYFPENRAIDLYITLDKLKLNIFQPYLSNLVTDLNGISNGEVFFTGTLDRPVMNGEIQLQKTSFVVDYLQTGYSLSDRAVIRNNDFLFEEVAVYDERGSSAILNGKISTNNLRNPRFDFNLQANNFNFLHTRAAHNQMYYGDAYASGRVGLTGSPGNFNLIISARTERGTHVFIPINQGRDIQENDFISFVGSGSNASRDETENTDPVKLGGITLDFQLEVTEDATTEIILDPRVGDVLQASGNGNIQFSIHPHDGFQMFGDYTIASGEYLFNLQNIISKRLKIQKGGNITWNGDPTAALISIQAIYNAKAVPGVLIPDAPEYMNNRMPVECHLIMEGNLLSPVISFDIVLPTAEEETRNVLRNAIATEEELTKQFLSLLVINNFSSVTAPSGGSTAGTGKVMAGVTASELLSNQLSNWLSQISNDFDIGVNYRRGDEMISSDQVEVALSTQIFDDRVSIRTNLDVNPGGDEAMGSQNTTTIAGDFDVEVKLTDNGRLRLKAYNRYNYDQLYKTSPYTQGVGFVYREDFNSFSDLAKRYTDAITGKNRKKKKKDKVPKATGESEGSRNEEGSR